MESRLIVHSWDFDGMLASEAYTDELKRLIIQAANEHRGLNADDYKTLAKFIIDKYPEFFDAKFKTNQTAEHVVFVGSDRQDTITDLNNGYKCRDYFFVTLSCFPFFAALVDELKNKYKVDVKLDPFLLEDVYYKQPAGTTFARLKDKYLHLDAEFIAELAQQMQKDPMDSNAANALFDRLKAAIVDKAADKDLKMRLPQYTDKSKLLIMYAQIHHANSLYSNGRSFEYHYADDRCDILDAAQSNLPSMASYIPDGTQIHLEQFIPPEIKSTLQHSSADNLFFLNFKKGKDIIGSGHKESDTKTTMLDIADTHQSLNEIFLNPVPEVLLQTIKKRMCDKAFLYIQLCVNELLVSDQSRGVKAMAKLLENYSKNNDASANVALLNDIKDIASKKYGSKIARSNESSFFKEHPGTASFFKALKLLDSDMPNTESLEATYHLIQHKPSNLSSSKIELKRRKSSQLK